jgi:hypothetical protein
MALKKKTGIDIGASAYVTDREPVLVPVGEDGAMLTLYARRLGCLEVTEISAKATASGVPWIIPMVAASIEDEDGNRFTDDQVRRLRKEVADPLFAAVIKVNKLDAVGEDGTAKN